MREGTGVVDVPAAGVLCGLGVDEDEAAAFGEGRQFGAAVPGLGASAAGVQLWGMSLGSMWIQGD